MEYLGDAALCAQMHTSHQRALLEENTNLRAKLHETSSELMDLRGTFAARDAELSLMRNERALTSRASIIRASALQGAHQEKDGELRKARLQRQVLAEEAEMGLCEERIKASALRIAIAFAAADADVQASYQRCVNRRLSEVRGGAKSTLGDANRRLEEAEERSANLKRELKQSEARRDELETKAKEAEERFDGLAEKVKKAAAAQQDRQRQQQQQQAKPPPARPQARIMEDDEETEDEDEDMPTPSPEPAPKRQAKTVRTRKLEAKPAPPPRAPASKRVTASLLASPGSPPADVAASDSPPPPSPPVAAAPRAPSPAKPAPPPAAASARVPLSLATANKPPPPPAAAAKPKSRGPSSWLSALGTVPQAPAVRPAVAGVKRKPAPAATSAANLFAGFKVPKLMMK
ncbi:hypothetical protein NFJ02_12g09560 [Pycnococcus provasolii]